jgi:hypothetical protein
VDDMPWQEDATGRVCARLVAEGSAWRDEDDVAWNAHWDCHQRAEREEHARNADPNASLRSLRGPIGAYTRWANTDDRLKATQPARDGLYAKFERQVDPEGKLSPQERAKRAEYARRAYYQRLALKSVQARQRRGVITRITVRVSGGVRALPTELCA